MSGYQQLLGFQGPSLLFPIRSNLPIEQEPIALLGLSPRREVSPLPDLVFRSQTAFSPFFFSCLIMGSDQTGSDLWIYSYVGVVLSHGITSLLADFSPPLVDLSALVLP